MTKFTDGPAAGLVLMLRRAPLFLRVVHHPDDGWNALDQLGDKPNPGEAIHAYRKVEESGWVHLRPGGRFPTAVYEHVPEQPDLPTLQARTKWQSWCEENAHAWVEERAKRRVKASC